MRNVLNKIFSEKNTVVFRKFNLIILCIVLILYLSNILFLTQLNSFFKFYFNDLLAIVLLFSVLNTIFIYKIKNMWLILLITILASFVWEYCALFLKPGSVFDYGDIFCYFVSMIIYLCIINIFEKFYLNK